MSLISLETEDLLWSTFGEEVAPPLLIRFLIEMEVISGFTSWTVPVDIGDLEVLGDVADGSIVAAFFWAANSAAFFF